MGKKNPKTMTFAVPITDGHSTKNVTVAASSAAAALQSLPHNPHVSIGTPKSQGWQTVTASVDGSHVPSFTVGTGNNSFTVEQGHPSYGHLVNTQPRALGAIHQFLEEISPTPPDDQL